MAQPAEIEERLDHDEPSYSVRYRDREYPIYSPDLDYEDGQSWGRAAHAFFSIVNDQLTGSQYRFYAINGGNDLGGMFLTSSECGAAKRSLSRRSDWPYIPTLDHPSYGQYPD